MVWFILYCIVGIVLGLLARDEQDHRALFTAGLGSLVVFMLFWPVIVLWFVHMALKNGVVIRHKGKEIWRSK